MVKFIAHKTEFIKFCCWKILAAFSNSCLKLKLAYFILLLELYYARIEDFKSLSTRQLAARFQLSGNGISTAVCLAIWTIYAVTVVQCTANSKG
jgi:hypothetical protein